MKMKSESEVTQSCPILSDLMDCSLPGSSVHWIFQARVLRIAIISQSSHSVMSDSLWPLGLQHTRLPCPITNSQSLLKLMSIKSMMPSYLSSSVVPFSSHLQSFPASGFFFLWVTSLHSYYTHLLSLYNFTINQKSTLWWREIHLSSIMYETQILTWTEPDYLTCVVQRKPEELVKGSPKRGR